jgi:hypothetical protein
MESRHLYHVIFNETKSFDYNIQQIYKIRYQFLNKLPNELIEYIFEKYLNFNEDLKMYGNINKYKNIQFKPNHSTFLPFIKLNVSTQIDHRNLFPNYTCNKTLHVKDNFYYVTCDSKYPELCTESQHNILVANELNKINTPFSLQLSSRKVNIKESVTDQFEKLIKERQKL